MTISEKEHEITASFYWMSLDRDLSAVIEIENQSFRYPWKPNDFYNCLTKGKNPANGIVAVYNGQLIGYIIYKIRKRFIEIFGIAVHPAYRRMGIGSQLLAKVMGISASIQQKKITIMIGERNLKGQFFFKNNGFKATAVVYKPFKGFNEDDGYVMEYKAPRPKLKPESKSFRSFLRRFFKE
ncbi:MAG: GNAT family N-acetyltransferase [Candidatus Pacebacteria bacterium]|nr:GNAT family N-acetyltransferase [Candidatus Paceibacterota bacterium]